MITVIVTVAVSVALLLSLTCTVSVYEDAVSWSRSPLTEICPVVVFIENLLAELPAVIEYDRLPEPVAETVPTTVPTAVFSCTENE